MSLLQELRDVANTSTIGYKLAAVITRGNKIPLTKIYCNTSQSCYHGAKLGSLHAEANAIIKYFGADLNYDRKKGWCLLWG